MRQNTLTHADVRYEARMEDQSPGNAGAVFVDTRDFTWKAYSWGSSWGSDLVPSLFGDTHGGQFVIEAPQLLASLGIV